MNSGSLEEHLALLTPELPSLQLLKFFFEMYSKLGTGTKCNSNITQGVLKRLYHLGHCFLDSRKTIEKKNLRHKILVSEKTVVSIT